jgi:DNA-binding MarR family transcriptional regulator
VTPSAATGGEPLARLFAIAFRQLIDGLHERLASQGWTDVRPSFGFVLLAARDEPTTATALAALLGTTKQAASKLVDTMEAAGYVARSVDDGDARQRPIRLTTRGRDLLTAVEAIYDDLEAEWADVIGLRRVAAIRRDLTEVLSDPQGELPPVRPGW